MEFLETPNELCDMTSNDISPKLIKNHWNDLIKDKVRHPWSFGLRIAAVHGNYYPLFFSITNT